VDLSPKSEPDTDIVAMTGQVESRGFPEKTAIFLLAVFTANVFKGVDFFTSEK
jgi:hypothetical protein